MKNIIQCLVIALAMIIALTSCTETSPATVAPSSPETATFSPNDPHVLSKILPDPLLLFPQAEFITTDPDDGSSYQFCLNHGTVEMFNKYVEATKDAGFTARSSFISGKIYQAFTEDGLFKTMISYYENTQRAADEELVTYVYVAVWSEEDDAVSPGS